MKKKGDLGADGKTKLAKDEIAEITKVKWTPAR